LPIIYIPILSKEQSEYHGHVQDYIDRLIYNDATYYICGSRQFVIEIANLLKSKGINKIVIEAF